MLPVTDRVLDDLSFLRMSPVAYWRHRNRWRFSEAARPRFRGSVGPSCPCPSHADTGLLWSSLETLARESYLVPLIALRMDLRQRRSCQRRRKFTRRNFPLVIGRQRQHSSRPSKIRLAPPWTISMPGAA